MRTKEEIEAKLKEISDNNDLLKEKRIYPNLSQNISILYIILTLEWVLGWLDEMVIDEYYKSAL